MNHPDHIARVKQLCDINSGINWIAPTQSKDKCCNRKLQVKKLSDTAIIPTKAHLSDAGWDLYASEACVIPPKERCVIKTGISLAIPEGYVGLIWPRSGLAVKKGVDVLAGVVDAGYRGEVMVCLLNTQYFCDISGQEDHIDINVGDRIAQILFQRVPYFKLIEVDDLKDTERSESGFGSSGK